MSSSNSKSRYLTVLVGTAAVIALATAGPAQAKMKAKYYKECYAHAHEVIDALGRGETDVYAAGSQGMRDRIFADPQAFEKDRIQRFYENPLVIRNHT